MNKNYTVTSRSDGNWGVVRDGASRSSVIKPTQAEAIQAARPLAQQARSELRIQDRNGRYRESWSYGNDPFPPKG